MCSQMDAPLIGITTYGRNADRHFTLPSEYVESIRRAGGIPMLLPPGEPRLQDWFESIDGLVIAGGCDVDPNIYDGAAHETIQLVDPERDQDEVALIHQSVETGMPMLAVCRGLQVLNIAFGGDLHADIPSAFPDAIEHRRVVGGNKNQPVPHQVTLDPGSRLAQVMQTSRFDAPSMHHQAIDELGDGLVAVGHAPDGIIEAVEMPEHPWLLAMQWHPELASAEQPEHQRVFEGLVQATLGLD